MTSYRYFLLSSVLQFPYSFNVQRYRFFFAPSPRLCPHFAPLHRKSCRRPCTDPTVCPPGFNLPRHLWSTLNRFRTGQGRCAANLVRWHQASDPSCICGNPRQTVDHIANRCPITRFPGDPYRLHQADEDAISWLGTQSKR